MKSLKLQERISVVCFEAFWHTTYFDNFTTNLSESDSHKTTLLL